MLFRSAPPSLGASASSAEASVGAVGWSLARMGLVPPRSRVRAALLVVLRVLGVGCGGGGLCLGGFQQSSKCAFNGVFLLYYYHHHEHVRTMQSHDRELVLNFVVVPRKGGVNWHELRLMR